MIQGKYLNSKDDLSPVISIRKEVFEKELSILNNVSIEDKDELSVNVIVNDGKSNVGTGRVTLENGNFFIDMICVLKDYRNQGYGEFIVRLLADKALVSGAEYVHLEAPIAIVPFFEKLYFTKVESKNEITNSIPMVVNLAQFKSPCGHSCHK